MTHRVANAPTWHRWLTTAARENCHGAEAGRTGRLPHPYGKAVLVAHGREIAKVTHGFMKEIGISKYKSLGWGSPNLEDVASLADPSRRTSHSWVDDLQSDEVKSRQRQEAGQRLDAALGAPVRRLRKRQETPVATPPG